MANWLEKFVAKPGASANLPAVQKQNAPAIQPGPATQPAALPPATVVYAIAAAALFAIAICFLMSHAWITGFLVLLPAACFLGFSIHFLKNP